MKRIPTVTLALLLGLPACGDDTTKDKVDFPAPRDIARPSDGGLYGWDGGGGEEPDLLGEEPDLTPPPPDLSPPPDLRPDCAEADRLCKHTFTWPAKGGEKAVELRADWIEGWSRGQQLSLTGGNTWKVDADVPWGKQGLYKYIVTWQDGKTEWFADPNAPDAGDQNHNSLLSPVTCADTYACVGGSMPPPDMAMAGPCSDGKKNNAETDVDCGGGTCPACAEGQACAKATDCLSGVCTSGVCKPGAASTWDWRDGVMYFVFVDRFSDGNAGINMPIGVEKPADFQGGDWAGVTAKIKSGYFTSLGVNVLWLTVPMDQTDSKGKGVDDNHMYSAYHGYWPRDLSKTEKRFGTDADLKTLVDEAHKAGIKVLIDYAMNHVHKDSPVYTQHMDWFNPINNNGKNCVCGQGCSWDGAEGEYCWFTDYLPDFNFGNATARKFSVDNAIDWLKKTGADGFRLDAVKHINVQWLLDLRARVKTDIEPTTKQHVYFVGETFTGDTGTIEKYINPDTKLDGQFDFPLRNKLVEVTLARKGSMGDLEGTYSGLDKAYTANGAHGALMSTFLGNHDVPRSIHFAQGWWSDPWHGAKDCNWANTPGKATEEWAYDRLSVGLAVLLTNPGIPLIYYGDEIGLPGCGDPDNRRMMEWSGYNAGQAKLLDRVKKLGKARAALSPLRRGKRTTLDATNDTWTFKMVDGTKEAYVAINRGDATGKARNLPAKALKDSISGQTFTGPETDIPARSFLILSP